MPELYLAELNKILSWVPREDRGAGGWRAKTRAPRSAKKPKPAPPAHGTAMRPKPVRTRTEPGSAGGPAAHGSRVSDLRGAIQLPAPTPESAPLSILEFSIRWHGMRPERFDGRPAIGRPRNQLCRSRPASHAQVPYRRSRPSPSKSGSRCRTVDDWIVPLMINWYYLWIP